MSIEAQPTPQLWEEIIQSFANIYHAQAVSLFQTDVNSQDRLYVFSSTGLDIPQEVMDYSKGHSDIHLQKRMVTDPKSGAGTLAFFLSCPLPFYRGWLCLRFEHAPELTEDFKNQIRMGCELLFWRRTAQNYSNRLYECQTLLAAQPFATSEEHRIASAVQVSRQLGHLFGNVMYKISNLLTNLKLHTSPDELEPIDKQIRLYLKQLVNSVNDRVMLDKCHTLSLERYDLRLVFDIVLRGRMGRMCCGEPFDFGDGVTVDEDTSDAPQINCDIDQLTCLVRQLCENIKRFVGLGKVQISALPVPNPIEGQPELAQIIFEDDGEGMSEEMLEICTQVGSSTRPDLYGGLGLAICQKICENHHGALSIENIEPHGLKVTVTLPTDLC